MEPIIDPVVIFVTFEMREGKMYARIPHAFGDGEHWEQLVTEDLSIQFSPRIIRRAAEENVQVLGVEASPLTSVTQ